METPPSAPPPPVLADSTPPGASGEARPRCKNCGTPLHGPYCSDCGQRDFDFHRSFGHALRDAIETWFNVDASFLHGFYTLLFQPGRMTRDFNEGRRARHVPPFRFYLVVSILFFVTFTPPQLHLRNVDLDLGGSNVVTDGAAFKATSPVGSSERALEDRIIAHLRDPDAFVQTVLERVPNAMLIGVPVLALMSRLLFRKSRRTYLQHLILALHLQTFAFLLPLVVSGWSQLLGFFWPGGASLLGTAALISVIGAVPAIAASRYEGDEVASDTAENVGNDLGETVNDVMADYLRIPPTISVNQGAVVMVRVDADIEFY